MTSYQCVPPVTITTGVSKTSLGTVNKASENQNLIEFTPYQTIVVSTTAESVMTNTQVESISVKDILPKKVINPIIQSGLGATYGELIPALKSFECNTPLQGGSNDIITAYGQAQIANTGIPLMGVEFHFSDSSPSRPQIYYDKPDNETSSGTSATTVTGGSLTINGGKTLYSLFGEVSLATPLASKPIIGSMIFQSANFNNSQGLEIAVQPVGVALGTTLSIGQPVGARRENVGMGMKSTCVINTSFRQGSAMTTASNFIAGIGYTKA